ncbi:unnamed protein product [Mytilus edulis]|uniref:CCHC-type domain-containing protein n=1 Tax=Mytilus edulis TaxID=6550 RepID=A0A8S3RFM2_MYTED|nr:unnamed protein product [Mytilus edulis]
MLLDKEISEFSAEMYLELIMTYNNDIHYDELNSFKEEEDLRTLSVLKLKNRLEKSLSVSIAKVEKMLKRELESSDLIRLCHIGIELANANSSDSRRQEKKRKSGNDDSSPSKKISGEPTHTCDNCASGEMSFREEELNDRILELDSLLQSTKYSKQKLVLQKSIVSFLSDLNPQKSLNDALPSDIRKFLVYKDDSGKTQIHKAQCKNRGVKGKFQCGCPLRLSAGSVDSLIGQLRAIFRDHGRGTDWNDMLGLGNPAASSIIKKYLSAIKLEQSMAAALPKHAVPLFSNKLILVSRYISYKMSNKKLGIFQKYILVRDKTFFNILSFTGDRAGDLGSVLTDQVRWLPGEEGVIISMMKGKTIDISDPRVVIIYNSVNTEFCPVTVLRDYIEFCKVSKLEIVGGYLFRPLAPSCMALSDVPFTSAAANARLKSHLTDLNIWEGETPHSTRSGCALTLTWLGLNSECIKSHVGWKSDKMLKHYTVTNEINEKSVSARSLSKLSDSEISHLTGKYQRYNNFEHFKKLKAEIELLKKGINVDVIEQALREVKEYAARSREINVDTLQLKLMHLDEVARRVGHQDRELYSMVLQRFLCHKNHERVGFLVTSLLSSPAETKLFEKEQKFLKIHGNELLSTKQQKEEVETKNLGNENQFQQFATMMQCMQSVLNPRPSTPFMAQRFAQNPRRMPGNGQRKPPSNYTGCFKCGDINHFKIDCPK